MYFRRKEFVFPITLHSIYEVRKNSLRKLAHGFQIGEGLYSEESKKVGTRLVLAANK